MKGIKGRGGKVKGRGGREGVKGMDKRSEGRNRGKMVGGG